jgi:hypothetical protein
MALSRGNGTLRIQFLSLFLVLFSAFAPFNIQNLPSWVLLTPGSYPHNFIMEDCLLRSLCMTPRLRLVQMTWGHWTFLIWKLDRRMGSCWLPVMDLGFPEPSTVLGESQNADWSALVIPAPGLNPIVGENVVGLQYWVPYPKKRESWILSPNPSKVYHECQSSMFFGSWRLL